MTGSEDTEPKSYDLIVIGSGPAGEKGAAQAAYFGKSVAMIEREPAVGGASANTGTLPSKTLRETSLFLSGFRNRDLSGINLTIKKQVTVGDFMAHEQHVAADERVRILKNLAHHKVDLFYGRGSFVDPHTIAVTPIDGPPIHLRGEVILLATGSSPHRPSSYPFEDPRVFDSDEILQIRDMPRSMLVVGGGVIGCEYACTFAILGVEVTLVEQRDRVVDFLDGELGASLREQMEAIGIKFYTGDSVAEFEAGAELTARLKSGVVVKPDAVLVSSGRGGNTKGLAIENVGLEVDARGRVKVNEQYQTTVPHVYAAGDVIGSPALSSTSMEQARIAMVHAFKLHYKSDLARILPFGIYTIPECSMAGETEESLRAKGTPYIAGKACYSANARGHIIGDEKGFLKLLFGLDDLKLLGVHVIGEQATELIHVGLTALLLDQTANLFINTCYNYPTLTELYKYATYDALGKRATMLHNPSTHSVSG
ncbi:MAG: Si-specific NAD(P)(+) transhydrogenase [Isosphaeraceae bacterium]